MLVMVGIVQEKVITVDVSPVAAGVRRKLDLLFCFKTFFFSGHDT